MQVSDRESVAPRRAAPEAEDYAGAAPARTVAPPRPRRTPTWVPPRDDSMSDLEVLKALLRPLARRRGTVALVAAAGAITLRVVQGARRG